MLLPLQAASLTTLDPRFWASRGAKDVSAPAVDAGRLLRIIQTCCCTDTQQDTAVMQVRRYSGTVWRAIDILLHACPLARSSHQVLPRTSPCCTSSTDRRSNQG